MSEKVLVDASLRFAVRRELSTLEGGVNELELVTRSINDECSNYMSSIVEYGDNVAEAMRSLQPNGMRKCLIRSTVDETFVDEDLLSSSEPRVVFRKQDNGQLGPELLMPQKMIEIMRDKIYPLMVDQEGIKPQDEIASAVAASTWYGLGKWTVETIDPRNVDDVNVSVAALEAISVLSGIDIENIDSEDSEVSIANSLAVVSYRMAGAMAYKGLARHLSAMGHDRIVGALSSNQRIFSAFFDKQAAKDKEHITPINFAMAKPLLKDEVEVVFDVLDPVARELQISNRLIVLDY